MTHSTATNFETLKEQSERLLLLLGMTEFLPYLQSSYKPCEGFMTISFI